MSLIMAGLSFAFAEPLAMLFCREEDLSNLSHKAMMIYSFSYLFGGFGIFITGMFTSLNNGLVSSIISFFRSLVFPILFLFTIPLIVGPDGIWISIIISEFGSGLLSFFFLFKHRKQYFLGKEENN